MNGDDVRIPYRLPEPAPLSFVLEAEEGDMFGEPFSLTHDVRAEREDGVLSVRPVEELDGDFTLFLPLAGRSVGITVATHRPNDEDGYFMLTLSPGEVGAVVQARDLTIVAGDFMDLDGGQVSIASPIGRGLMGAKEGQEVSIELPIGERRFKVLKLLTLPMQMENSSD